MFTGIIESLGKVKSARRTGDAMRLDIDLGNLAEGCNIGDSIAVSGICLTVASMQAGIASFDVSGETLLKSTLNKIEAGSTVNLERAMRADGRFAGHFVQGHIDGTAKIEKIEQQGQFARITFTASDDLLRQMVIKGSVAIDGISLTVADIGSRSFSIAVIPETLKRTTLGQAKTGNDVNIEIDIISKLVKRHVETILPSQEKLSMERLKEMGF